MITRNRLWLVMPKPSVMAALRTSGAAAAYQASLEASIYLDWLAGRG